MKRQLIHSINESRTVYVSDAFPGIALYRFGRCGWLATHLESGHVVSRTMRLRRIAAEFAERASQIVDFTLPAENLKERVQGNPVLWKAVRELQAEFGNRVS
jgi:hypothetical protein